MHVFDKLLYFVNRVLIKLKTRIDQLHSQKLMAAMASCGDDVCMHGHIQISGAHNMVLGTNVHIGTGAWIRAEGGVSIGDNTHISRNLLLYSVNHQYEGERLPYDEQSILKPVVIGKNVWIAMNVCIAPGSTIGDGAIIGMGAVVSGEVPKNAIVVSQPLRIAKYRDEKHYFKLESQGKYGGTGGLPY